MKNWLYIAAICLLAAGCHKTQPQRPTIINRPQEHHADSIIDLVEINQRMAEEADQQLIPYVTEAYSLQENGCWISGLRDIETALKDSQVVNAHIRIYDMDGTMYEGAEQQLTVGLRETTQAVTDALSMMHRGDSIAILAPWYMAYGSLGSNIVPPYTNVKITLKIE